MKIISLIIASILFSANPVFIHSQNTYIPDDNFEEALIRLGYDSYPLNDSVPTAKISNITRLDISNLEIVDLTGIEDFENLRFLNCNTNKLSKLDLSRNRNLIDVYCYENLIENLDLSNLINISRLYCYTNKLRSLELSKCRNLTHLYCHNNLIDSLDLSLNEKLTRIICNDNKLSRLNIRNGRNSKITYLFTRYNYSLFCIQVDDKSEAEKSAVWLIDKHTSFSELCTSTDIQEIYYSEESIIIFPNPASEWIEIVTKSQYNDMITLSENYCSPKYIHFYNFIGECVHIEQIIEADSNRIDISQLPAGIYFIISSEFQKIFVKK